MRVIQGCPDTGASLCTHTYPTPSPGPNNDPLTMESILALVMILDRVWFVRDGSDSNSRVLFTIPSKSIMVGIHLRATVIVCTCVHMHECVFGQEEFDNTT